MIEQALCPVLIGREEELATLEDGLLAASRGQGRIALLGGDAGLGKTRLATELMRRASRIGFRWLWGGCAESDLALPYIPFLEAFGNYFMTADVEALRARLGPAAGDLAALFPQFGGTAPDAGADAAGSKHRLYEAMLALLNAVGGEQGLLLVVEDLHWADASTRDLLDYIARRLRSSKVLVLGTYRRDEMHRKHPLAPLIQGWRRAGLADVIDLQPLSMASAERMIDAIFQRGMPGEFLDLLYARSEGNPFVLEEMLKDAIDRGDLFRSPDGTWERREVTDIRIPQTVADSILLRVERLEPDHADVLRAAAVLGRSFAYQTLMAVTGRSEDVVLAALRASVQQQLIEEDPQDPGRYRFRHALTRESVYEDMIEPERRRLHARAADALGTPGQVAAAELAHHLFAAGRFAEAGPVFLRAATEAREQFGFRDAITLTERGLPYMPDGIDRARVLCGIGELYWLVGESSFAVRYFEEGIQGLEAAGSEVEAAHFRVWLGRCYWEQNDIRRALREYERGRAELEPRGPSFDLAHVLIRLAGLRAFECDAEGCRALAAQAREVATASTDENIEGLVVLADMFLAISLLLSGEVTTGIAAIDKTFEVSLEPGLGWVAANTLANSCIFRVGPLRASEIRKVIDRGLDSLHAVYQWEEAIGFFDGLSRFLLGDIEGCFKPLRESRELLATGFHLFYNWGVAFEAEALAEFGDADGARAMSSLPDKELSHREERLWSGTRFIRMWLALGDVDAAARIARALAEEPLPIHGFREVVPEVVRALVESGDAGAAAAYLEATGEGDPAERAYVERARGLIAAAHGDHAAAVELLAEATALFEAAAYRIDEMHVRYERARSLIGAGETEGAKQEMEQVLALAVLCGARHQEARIRALAGEHGVVLSEPTDQPVAQVPIDPSALEQATERLVTVMFADVRGYTAMTAGTAPAELAERVGAFHRWGQREIERRLGLVDKFAGDAVMATFNAVGNDLDHARHAFEAAVALQERAGLVDLPVGVGIACGPAVVGSLAKGANVSVLGQTTNLAARLQAQAEAGEVVLDAEAYRRVRDGLAAAGFEGREESFELKGFAEPVTGFRVSRSR